MSLGRRLGVILNLARLPHSQNYQNREGRYMGIPSNSSSLDKKTLFAHVEAILIPRVLSFVKAMASRC